MARDGSGTYSLPATMAVANQTASSTTVNSIMSDVAQALTDSINKDGSKAFAANQSMGSNKLTALAAGTALTDAANLSQVQKGNVSQATTVAGTVDAITLAFTPAITSYTTGMVIRWTSGGANTVVAPTINIDSLGAKTVKKNPGGAALVAGDLGVSGTINEAVYNGTDFILLTAPATAISAASTSASGTVELATTTETLTGTDTARAVTPDGLAALWEQGADIASAGTITVGEGGYFAVTGTTTITDIDPGTDKAGREFELRFDGALTLTHGAALILPGAANITTAAGDVARFRSEGSDVVRCVAYNRANGTPVGSSGGMTLLGTITTTSGLSQSLNGLTLTNYKKLVLVWVGVSNAIATGTADYSFSDGTGDFVICDATDTASHVFNGTTEISLDNGSFISYGYLNTSTTYASGNANDASGLGPKLAFGRTRFTTSSTSVTVKVGAQGDAFDAGSVKVYGVT